MFENVKVEQAMREASAKQCFVRMAGQANEAQPIRAESELERELRRLQDAVDSCRALSSELESRLAPVLVSANESKGPPSQPESAPSSPLTEAIRGRTYGIETVAERLVGIMRGLVL